jgi:hypothetical protein
MYALSEIKKMNRKTAKKARGRQPYIAKSDKDPGVRAVPDFGDYRPKGFKLVESYFVDNSGFGTPGESALTFSEFVAKVKKDFGYAIIEQGQFQVYIGEFEKIV